MSSGTQIIKIGGSVLRDAEAYDAASRRLVSEAETHPSWIVVSAGAGVTDRLERIRTAGGLGAGVGELLALHEHLAGRPLPRRLRKELVEARADSNGGSSDRLMAWGERASSYILQDRLRRLGRGVPVTELSWGTAPRDTQPSIVPGFYLRGPDARIHLLPRGGGDLTAVLLAALLGIRRVDLWKKGGGIWLDGAAVPRIAADELVGRLADPTRPLQVDALRTAARLGIELRLEDPFGPGHTTVVTSGPVGLNGHRTPGELLGQILGHDAWRASFPLLVT